MADPVVPKDDTVEDDPVEVTGVAPTLDQVHQMNQSKVEQEDADEEDLSGDNADDTTEDDEDESGAAGGDSEDDSEGEPVVTTPEPVVDKPVETPAAAADDTTLDTDITKNVKGKVAIKDAEGNTAYFNNLDEVPDDFEPASYKALMVGTKALLQKEQDDAAAAKDAQTSAEQAAHLDATNKLQESWESDASALVQKGLLPNEPSKLASAKEEVYAYIESEMKKGNIITSFNQAYKSLMYDKQQAKAEEDQKNLNDAKKKRGAIVQGGSGGDSGGSSNTRGNKVIEAPPTGVGLDAVHARAIASL